MLGWKPRSTVSDMLLELVILGAVLLLLSCAGQTPTPGPSAAVCLIWKPTSFDRLNDTLETIERAKAQNKVRKDYCGD